MFCSSDMLLNPVGHTKGGIKRGPTAHAATIFSSPMNEGSLHTFSLLYPTAFSTILQCGCCLSVHLVLTQKWKNSRSPSLTPASCLFNKSWLCHCCFSLMNCLGRSTPLDTASTWRSTVCMPLSPHFLLPTPRTFMTSRFSHSTLPPPGVRELFLRSYSNITLPSHSSLACFRPFSSSARAHIPSCLTSIDDLQFTTMDPL